VKCPALERSGEARCGVVFKLVLVLRGLEVAPEGRVAVAGHMAQVAGEVGKSRSLRPFRSATRRRSARAFRRGGGTTHRHGKRDDVGSREWERRDRQR
jgi:hypothetical protein